MSNQFSSTDGKSFEMILRSNRPHSESILVTMDELCKEFGRMPEIRDAAVAMLSGKGVGNGDDQKVVAVLIDFVKSKLKWLADPAKTEFIVSPLLLLVTIRDYGEAFGDCDDHVILLCSLILACGIEARPCAVKLYPPGSKGGEIFNHVIAQVKLDGVWQDIDPCAKNLTFQPHYLQRQVVE